MDIYGLTKTCMASVTNSKIAKYFQQTLESKLLLDQNAGAEMMSQRFLCKEFQAAQYVTTA